MGKSIRTPTPTARQCPRVNVVAELIEKRSAKTPGRPVFNAMLGRIEAREASGILAWHPDRLARNTHCKNIG